MYVGTYGWYNTARFTKSNYKMAEAQEDFLGNVYRIGQQKAAKGSASPSVGGAETEADQEQAKWEERLQKWNEEMQRIKEENERYSEWLEERRKLQKLKQKKLREKKALKEYLARQDEISQLNERLSLERAVGEDVYIEKAPLSKSLGVAELLELL